MAVVPGGSFGNGYATYNQLKDARNWNTKNYDYATVKNKGEVDEDAKNETVDTAGNPITYGTGLFVESNKNGYFDANGRFIPDTDHTTYQVRDKYGRVDNNYYVDQETGDVYFRPAVAAGNSITLPATTPINSYTPQYFGTSFNLDTVPNPESLGQGTANNIIYSALGAGNQYSEILVNGVQISVNGLDTTTKTAIPATPADALYYYTDSFTSGADDFTAVKPLTKWKDAVVQWPGAGGTVSTGGGTGPVITNANAIWYPDITDTDYFVNGASNVGGTDFIFRKKFTIGAAIPTTPVYLNVGAADHFDLYVNGTLVTSNNWPNSSQVDIQPYLQAGDNVIGIHASDGDGDEGLYVSMNPTEVAKIGVDLSASQGGWEAGVGNVNPAYPAGTFTDPWTYDPTLGKYTNSEPGKVFRQSYFNSRTADNFIMNARLSFMRGSGVGGNPEDWAGFQIRATNPDDLPTTSGYTVAFSQSGKVSIYKAHADINPPATDPISGVPYGDLVATTNIAAFGLDPTATIGKDIQIRANGTQLIVSVNGTQILTYTDETGFPYTDGYTSFVSNGPQVAYDNFQLSSYSTSVQLLSKALRKGDNNIVIKGYDTSALTVNASGSINGVNLSTANIPPNLGVTDIMSSKYKASSRVDIAHPDPNELDPNKAYWSVSQNSALGIAGKITFQNREGGSLQRVRDQFTNVNNVMQDITSLLGAEDDLFKSHLNLIR